MKISANFTSIKTHLDGLMGKIMNGVDMDVTPHVHNRQTIVSGLTLCM